MQEQIPLLPVTGWKIAGIRDLKAIMLTLDYLTHAMQPDEQSHQSGNYVFHTAQARELAQRILVQCDLVDTGATQGTHQTKH